jgi:histidinol-phosphate aminotransferase
MGILELYQTERQTVNNSIMLDANEHYKQWVKVPNSALTNLNRYPDSSALALRHKLAESYCGGGMQPKNILITSGSIEAIDVLITAYKPSRLILNTPTYDVYKLRAAAHGSPCELIPLDTSSQPQADKIIEQAKKGSMVVLISPNNPTGKLMEPALVRKIAQNSQGMVVIDEAYIEFAGLQNSMQLLAKEYPNVIVLRTFSKAWGLAGIRLGYIISQEHNIRHLAPYRNAYSVNALALTIGLHALDQQDELKVQIENVLECKSNLIYQFERVGITAYETDANFILLDIPDVHTVHQALRQQSILVRPRPLLGNQRHGLRITVGSPDENKAMFDAIVKVLT